VWNLENEVDAWSSAVHADGCRRSASVDELRDHLYCEIERGRSAGLSDRDAFARATTRLGSREGLAAEHAKDRSWWRSACAALLRAERGFDGRVRGYLIAHALVWAALTIATMSLMKGAGADQAAQWVLLVAIVPCWLSSDLVLRGALRSGRR
jgi:hypothetical protein